MVVIILSHLQLGNSNKRFNPPNGSWEIVQILSTGGD
jgi:hypothetical protein